MERAREEVTVPDEEAVADYYSIKAQLTKYNDDVQAVVTHPRFCLPFLQPGRLVRIKDGDADFGWGCIVNFQKKLPTTKKGEPLPSDDDKSKYIVDVLLQCDTSQKIPTPSPAGAKGEMVVVPCVLGSVANLSSVRVYIPKDLKTPESRQSVAKSVQEVKSRFKDDIPLLDPVDDMNIEDEAFKKLFAVSSISSPPHLSSRLTFFFSYFSSSSSFSSSSTENRDSGEEAQEQCAHWVASAQGALRTLRPQGAARQPN